MSLKARLTALMTGMVALAVLTLSLLQLHSVVGTWLRSVSDRAVFAGQVLKNYIRQRTADLPATRRRPPPTREELKQYWAAALEGDRELIEMISTTLVQARAIVEISVADPDGLVIASSNPERFRTAMVIRLPLQRLLELGPLDRIAAIFGGRLDYETRVELGFPDQPQPVFVIQVLVSSVLLRDAIRPEVTSTLAVSLLALLIATLLAWWAARLALRPLARISRQIDLIAQGDPAQGDELRPSSSGEYAVVQEKLRLLGEQVRGAREGVTQLRGSVEQLLERLEDAILMAGADGVVRIASPAAERMFGRPREEIVGRALTELLPPDSPAGCVLAAALDSGASLTDVPVDWVMAGTPTRLLLNANPLPGGAGCILRLRDVEGRQLLESQLNLSQRLSAINRLTGGVAHEIKNPLNSIALRLELLKSRFLPEAPQAKPEIDIIAQEITRLDRVVRTFLDFTRPLELQLREVDLAGLAQDVLAFMRPETERAGIEVGYSARVAPVRVRGDNDLLKQALMNIVRNAMEAMPRGGRMTVVVAHTGRDALVAVTDTGPGIAPDNRERIFQLYYSTKQDGSGIGLAMAYRAVQLHGGSIEVDSEPGQGATFRLRLPLQWVGGRQ
jgi:hypothetical protein